MAEVALEVHNLIAAYHQKPVLWNIDFEAPEKQLIGIIGPNGSGKSTLLKCIMGLVPASSGYVRIFGQPLDDVRDRVSYVPQRESVDWDFPASVMDVVMMGRYQKAGIFRRINAEDKRIAEEALEKVQMQDFKNRQISQLSGGQQQRVFIARSLAQQADIYLMDEPFAGVDAASENAILKILTDMRDQGKTVVVVHHDLHTVSEYFNWIVMLNTRMITAGPLAETLTADNLRAAYGGQLTILDEIAQRIKNQDLPIRERDFEDR